MTNIFSQMPSTLIRCLMAAFYVLMIECAIVRCQTTPPAAETDNPMAQLNSPISVASTTDFQTPLNNRQPAKKNTEKTFHYGKRCTNPFKLNSDKPCETGTASADSTIQPVPAIPAKSLRTEAMEDAEQIAMSEQTTDMALVQSMSILPAKLILDSNGTWDFELQEAIPAKLTHDSNGTWDFELQSESDDRSLSLTNLTTQPTYQLEAVTPHKTKLIYQPAVPSVDKHGRMVLKPKVMLSSGEIISGYYPQ